MPPDNKTPKPSLEQLLKFKRLEKPEPAFWEKFDRELRHKQLASLVEKQPWYSQFKGFALLFARKSSPVAAFAVVLTIGYFSLTSSFVQTKNQPTPDSTLPSGNLAQIEVEVPEVKVEAVAPELANEAIVPSFRAEARYVTNIISKPRVSGQRFETISTPQAFLANFSQDRKYVAKTFSTQPTIGRSFQKKAITQF
ncbi:MAG: hypothetical protein JKY51_01580 [Opitutaceae bacterium]|nr:hypothetical protein [Opitutaceae bacterium]